MMLLQEAMQEDHQQPSGKPKNERRESVLDVASAGLLTPFEDDDNSISRSQSSDIECGSVFSSSAYNKDDDDDSPPMMRRQVTHSGENNRDFELIEREIGMCRPVSVFSALCSSVVSLSKPENGICEVHVLGDTPIQIQENHFAKPLERNDTLNAPGHLPVPNFRFSIRQISIVWHIYGGSDFAQPRPSNVSLRSGSLTVEGFSRR